MSKRAKQRTVWSVLVIVILALLYLGARTLLHAPRYYIQDVVVQGVPKQQESAFEDKLQPFLRQSLVNLNIQALSKQVLSFPWVSEVTVRRIWPNRLEIIVEPQKLVATWNGQNALNDFGEVFPLKKGLSDAIHLSGPPGSAVEVYSFYQQFQMMLDPLNVNITELIQSSDGAWSFTLNNGLKVEIGAKDVLTRLQRFVKVYPKVFKTSKDLKGRYVDLRYAHGMAVSRGIVNGKKTN